MKNSNNVILQNQPIFSHKPVGSKLYKEMFTTRDKLDITADTHKNEEEHLKPKSTTY